MTRIGILETGAPPAALQPTFGRYPDMMQALLAAQGDFSFTTFRVAEGDQPANLGAADAWLVTGSPHGVYEDHDWLAPFFDLLRAIRAARQPMVGICFGHQALAQAFGGEVRKSDKGWGIGPHQYHIVEKTDWMTPIATRITLAASHQDQIAQIPDGALLFASNAHCQFAGLDYGAGIVSFQGHPEFTAPYAQALLRARAGGVIPADEAMQAHDLYGDQRLDADLAATWIAGLVQNNAEFARD